ncbi:TetR/AcrR family transcriptional regulator [Loigolactobacillus jiayinensis]|uniref:TetR/AcrR family transcriptional regulator n=1 Tax=Loigolactobacillus jiayinensis TaxID=2486016 RepID=A0ABW1R9J0_9LACO|nr:TetR/AcrR family transcriptional regulator [Loigolactobacillus jiayinensis]
MQTTIFDNYRKWVQDQTMPKGKRAVLLASLDLFAQHGYASTSTAQIAQQAAVSQATIFKYFKTKQDLLLAILQPIIENLIPQYRDDFLPKINQFATLPTIVHFIVSDRYQFIKANADAMIILLTELLTNDTVHHQFFAMIQSSQPLFMQHVVPALKKAGIHADLDLGAVIRTIVGQLMTYFFQQRLMPNIPVDEAHDLQLIEAQIIRAIEK